MSFEWRPNRPSRLDFTFSTAIFRRRPPFLFFVWVENRLFLEQNDIFRSWNRAIYKRSTKRSRFSLIFLRISSDSARFSATFPPPICRPLLLYRIAIDIFFFRRRVSAFVHISFFTTVLFFFSVCTGGYKIKTPIFYELWDWRRVTDEVFGGMRRKVHLWDLLCREESFDLANVIFLLVVDKLSGSRHRPWVAIRLRGWNCHLIRQSMPKRQAQRIQEEGKRQGFGLLMLDVAWCSR